MLNLPNTPVFNKIAANNARIAPNADSNNTVTEHKNFSMLHPQRASEDTLMGVLNQLDLDNPTKETNGVIKGKNKSGDGNFMITPGVIKFKPGHGNCDTPSMPPTDYPGPAQTPASYPPAPNTYSDGLTKPLNLMV
jgi:hypothetical protein